MIYFENDKIEIISGFIFPPNFLTEIAVDPLPEYEPWFYLCKFPENLIYWMQQAEKQYPTRNLIPFAKYELNDDVACFDANDLSGDPKVLIIHFFASTGWELHGEYQSFNDWLTAVSDDGVDASSHQAR